MFRTDSTTLFLSIAYHNKSKKNFEINYYHQHYCQQAGTKTLPGKVLLTFSYAPV